LKDAELTAFIVDEIPKRIKWYHFRNKRREIIKQTVDEATKGLDDLTVSFVESVSKEMEAFTNKVKSGESTIVEVSEEAKRIAISNGISKAILELKKKTVGVF